MTPARKAELRRYAKHLRAIALVGDIDSGAMLDEALDALEAAEARAAALEAMAGPGSITTLRRLVLALDARGVVFGDDAIGDELCDAYNEARHSCDQADALAKEIGCG